MTDRSPRFTRSSYVNEALRHTHTHTLSLSHTHTHTLSLSLNISLSLYIHHLLGAKLWREQVRLLSIAVTLLPLPLLAASLSLMEDVPTIFCPSLLLLLLVPTVFAKFQSSEHQAQGEIVILQVRKACA